MDKDLTSWEVEQLRRSVAMLPPGAAALGREQALRILDQLRRLRGREERRDGAQPLPGGESSRHDD